MDRNMPNEGVFALINLLKDRNVDISCTNLIKQTIMFKNEIKFNKNTILSNVDGFKKNLNIQTKKDKTFLARSKVSNQKTTKAKIVDFLEGLLSTFRVRRISVATIGRSRICSFLSLDGDHPCFIFVRLSLPIHHALPRLSFLGSGKTY